MERSSAQTGRSEGRPLLSAADALGIASLELRARAVAEGVLAGAHRSRRLGASTEFADHKLYAPGDELKRLDWKAYARVDRFYVRRYEEETNLDVYLVVDASGSMAYAGGAQGTYRHSKLDYAATLAAAIAWLAGRRSDGVGLSIFAGEEQTSLLPSARRASGAELLRCLETMQARGPTALLDTLEQVGRRLHRNTLIVVLSDLLEVRADALDPLAVLRRRGADVLLLHTLDRDELDFPFDGVVRFEDMEQERAVQVDASGVRAAYLDELRAFLAQMQRGAHERDLRYCLAPTDGPPAELLRRALTGGPLLGRVT